MSSLFREITSSNLTCIYDVVRKHVVNIGRRSSVIPTESEMQLLLAVAHVLERSYPNPAHWCSQAFSVVPVFTVNDMFDFWNATRQV